MRPHRIHKQYSAETYDNYSYSGLYDTSKPNYKSKVSSEQKRTAFANKKAHSGPVYGTQGFRRGTYKLRQKTLLLQPKQVKEAIKSDLQTSKYDIPDELEEYSSANKAVIKPSKYTSAYLDIEECPEKNMSKGTMSTRDSIQNVKRSRLFIPISQMGKSDKKCLNSSETTQEDEDAGQTEETQYNTLPNYEEIKHFEEDLTDREFMKIVVKQLKQEEGDINYQIFKSKFMPKHRKPNFEDYLRLRRLEKIMLD